MKSDPRHRHGQTERTHRRNFQLVRGDIEILQHIYAHRLLRLDNLESLTCRSDKALARRLRKLTAHKFLHQYRPTVPKHVYTLGRAAIPILVEHGLASPELLGKRIRHELNDLFLKHETMIADFHVLLTLASQSHPMKLVKWEEGRTLYDHVSFFENGVRCRLPVRPDAFFTLTDSRQHSSKDGVHLFLEVDRSTTTQGRFQDKLVAYRHYFEHGRHRDKHGIRNFRVLSLARTPQRVRNLCETAEKVLPPAARKFYLFGCLERSPAERPTAIFTSQFMSARDFRQGTTHTLF